MNWTLIVLGIIGLYSLTSLAFLALTDGEFIRSQIMLWVTVFYISLFVGGIFVLVKGLGVF